MKEPTEKLVVLVSDATIPLHNYTTSLIDHVNALQHRVVCTADYRADHDFEVRVVPKDEEYPYSVANGVAFISTAFAHAHSITTEPVYYLAYFCSVALLELLHQREQNAPYVMFPRAAYRDVNEHVWLGTLPRAVQITVGRMAGLTDEMRLLVDAINDIREGNFDQQEKLVV